ncbi:hypothetical protein [Mycoplasma todarodis]|uniref:Uncharacterized protein n=1 Tax=Mycoplasma todarodis TaxID=1937191 RepID=A0A4R0XMY1_9MOLU|nr:hypothetical protein [Mycoplasma todarodis]TCG12094.1 hypothetical protein C4B25_00165 [Mycoplasma todarodis]
MTIKIKKISMGLGALITTAMIPIVVTACSEQNKGETTYINKTFNSISEAQHGIWFDFAHLATHHGSIVFNENLNITIINNGVNINFKFQRGENRENLTNYLHSSLIQVAQQVKNDVNILSFLNSDYLWDMAVLSRTPKNGSLDINDPKITKAPYIIAANISNWMNPWDVLVDFELSDGQILFGVYNFTKGLETHISFSNTKWNKLPWTQQPNNKTKSVENIFMGK